MEPFATRANVTCLDVPGGWSLSIYSKTEKTRLPIRRPSLKLNAVSNWGPLAVNLIVGLLLTPYLIGHLGKGGYGIWALVGSLLGYYGLLRLGVGSGIMRYVPFYKGTGDHGAASEVVSTGMVMSLAVGLIILFASMQLAEPVARFYKGGAALASLIRILGIAAALECAMRILDACVRAHEHWVVANVVTIVASIGRALGLAGCVYLGYGVVEMGYVVLVVTILMSFAMAVVFARFCPLIQLRPSMIKLSQGQALVSFGLLSTIATLAYTLSLPAHNLIIGKLLSLEAVAIYAIPVLLMRNARELVRAPTRVLWPRFAYLDGKNCSKEVASLFLRSTRITAIVACGITFAIFALGPSFIHLWVGEDFRAAHPVLLLLAGGALIENSQVVMFHLLGGTGRQGIQAVFAAIESVIGVSLSIILTWQLDLVGAALGFVIAIVLIRGLIFPWYICRELNISAQAYYGTCLMRPVLIFVALSAGLYCRARWIIVDDWVSLVMLATAAGTAYALATYCITLESEDRRRVNAVGSTVLTLIFRVRGNRLEDAKDNGRND